MCYIYLGAILSLYLVIKIITKRKKNLLILLSTINSTQFYSTKATPIINIYNYNHKINRYNLVLGWVT